MSKMSGSSREKHKITHLHWLDPSVLYEELFASKTNTMGVDFGLESTGLCIGFSKTGNVYPVVASDWKGNYKLSPLERFLNDNYKKNGGGVLVDRFFVPHILFSPQAVNAQKMATSVIRDIHNKLAKDYGVKFYVFGFSADKRFWNDDNNYAFIKAQVKKLENDRGLDITYFTFVDEANSTKRAEDFLKSRFPELFCLQMFKEKYRDILRLAPYKKNHKKFTKDYFALKKRVIDVYAAAHFTKTFLNMGFRKRLNPTKSQGKAKFDRMKTFANSCGYGLDGSASM